MAEPLCDRFRRSLVCLLLLLSLATQCGAAEPGDALPLEPGSYWIYRGALRVGPGGGEEPVPCVLDVRVLVTDLHRWEDGVYIAMLRKTSTPLGECHLDEHFHPPSQVFAYFVDHDTVHEIHSHTLEMLVGHEDVDEMSTERVRESLADDAPVFVFPLRDGQRFSGPDGAVRRDDDYKWVVTKGDPIDLLGRRHTDVYVLRYRSLPGTTEVHFVPGVGIVRDRYTHHGTVIEWDLRLVAYHLEKLDSGKGEPVSQADD